MCFSEKGQNKWRMNTCHNGILNALQQIYCQWGWKHGASPFRIVLGLMALVFVCQQQWNLKLLTDLQCKSCNCRELLMIQPWEKCTIFVVASRIVLGQTSLDFLPQQQSNLNPLICAQCPFQFLPNFPQIGDFNANEDGSKHVLKNISRLCHNWGLMQLKNHLRAICTSSRKSPGIVTLIVLSKNTFLAHLIEANARTQLHFSRMGNWRDQINFNFKMFCKLHKLKLVHHQKLTHFCMPWVLSACRNLQNHGRFRMHWLKHFQHCSPNLVWGFGCIQFMQLYCGCKQLCCGKL